MAVNHQAAGEQGLAFLLFITILDKLIGLKQYGESPDSCCSCSCSASSAGDNINSSSYGLSWRLAVEANNVGPWRTVPIECFPYIETYMSGGQYYQDLKLITDQILSYVNEIDLKNDGMDAWVLDVDDTCISNILYYKGRKYGSDPFDSTAFKAWILKGVCPAIHAVLELYNKLICRGFKVFFITGRDQHTLAKATIHNLHNQGFIAYERLILRNVAYKGQSAVRYKSETEEADRRRRVQNMGKCGRPME
ncbi:Acid phosphatase 1 [Quillaja saponaria]|uniref:Acid phosphatase 1 n=1 Tax=Quillaja saponaria TaxID=32244 RepID=A0AAD7PNF9_QUISA|nr:Acid phosphatase 1 [Quillaja saponaria]